MGPFAYETTTIAAGLTQRLMGTECENWTVISLKAPPKMLITF